LCLACEMHIKVKNKSMFPKEKKHASVVKMTSSARVFCCIHHSASYNIIP
jgi:hypothetical protein